tara:strand:- start:2459 stop:3340 length:882 start_codon:yes stop_codon:yes gene_type:complete
LKLLVLGSKGQLGRCLGDQLANTDHDVVYASRDQIDITDFHNTNLIIKDIKAHIVINTSAFTAVDRAEEDKKLANLTNNLAVQNLANICDELDCWLIHISTDYVFDGTSSIPYLEIERTNPQGIYGVTKLKGEQAIKSSGCKHLIIRTAWVFSEYGSNFLKTMLHLGRDRNELSIVGDQFGCPTYAQDIAKAIVTIINSLNIKIPQSGIYHYCGDKPCSWFDFAKEIFQKASDQGLNTPDKVFSINTSQYPTLAKRPAYSVLDTSKIRDTFGVAPSDWNAAISKVISSLQKSR